MDVDSPSPSPTHSSPLLSAQVLPEVQQLPGTLATSPPASPTRSPSPGTARQARLAALERRIAASAASEPVAGDDSSYQPFDEHYAMRIEFRRLVEPGIMRPNSKEVAMSSLRTLSMIAENLIREPDNAKFRQFKPTNSIIKRDLVDPKGALEYAVALGFRPQVDRFQPLYVFNTKYWTDLKVGASVLQEAMAVELEKQQREEASKKSRKAEEELRVQKVKDAFMDDRKSKQLRDQRERAAAEAKRRNQQQEAE
ncbi:hypothetical protein FA95DRAFT_1552024 [Auriscalpium vulgare]|uniref:Uncharacterized protein n=1 Tax=Auriscalpium vulgare TaxID=40419 RepID=A0ACB8SBE8_9AGAM|nr:hypothetical protein FA95DRAFT_1552024 [Auriscalpium vulgare]